MKGNGRPPKIYRIPPTGVATRHSTDLIAVGDRILSQALRFIRNHALEGISVSDVVEVVPISRSLLERRFRAVLERSPYEEIQAVRLRKAKELLDSSKLSVAEISERVGYASAEYLSAAFKKKLGMSPRAYASRQDREGKGISRALT